MDIRTHCEVIETAKLYLNYHWLPTSKNVFHGNDPTGHRIDTPDNAENGWVPNRPARGVAYALGGFDTPATFGAAVREGFPVGNTAPSRSFYVAGIDCSGFVSRCWGLAVHVPTKFLPSISIKLDSHLDLEPGDIINKIDDHVFLFVRFLGIKRTFMLVYEATKWCVQANRYSVARLIDEGYLPLRRKTPEKESSSKA